MLFCLFVVNAHIRIIIYAFADCSTCGAGQYISINCTSTSDRVCSTCTTCREGTFTQEVCQPYHDTNCKGTPALIISDSELLFRHFFLIIYYTNLNVSSSYFRMMLLRNVQCAGIVDYTSTSQPPAVRWQMCSASRATTAARCSTRCSAASAGRTPSAARASCAPSLTPQRAPSQRANAPGTGNIISGNRPIAAWTATENWYADSHDCLGSPPSY